MEGVKNLKFFRKNKKAQVWVETVIYTLIALTIIGLFLSFAKPKIEEIQDKSIIEQSVEMLEGINEIINSVVEGGAGNQRVIDVMIKEGDLFVDGENDTILFKISSKYTFTEPGSDGEWGKYIEVGDIVARTKKIGKTNTINLLSNYSQVYNITYNGEDKLKVVSKSPAIYKITILNKGEDKILGGLPKVDISF